MNEDSYESEQASPLRLDVKDMPPLRKTFKELMGLVVSGWLVVWIGTLLMNLWIGEGRGLYLAAFLISVSWTMIAIFDYVWPRSSIISDSESHPRQPI